MPEIEPGENVIVCGNLHGELIMREMGDWKWILIVYIYGTNPFFPTKCGYGVVKRAIPVPSFN